MLHIISVIFGKMSAVKFGEFDVAHGCWENYIERFSFALQAAGIVDDSIKKANLLASGGPDLYDLIISLIAPSKISEVTFTTIKSKLDNHFHPTPNEIVQSYKFHTRNQEEGEMIRDYIAQLRKLSIHCNFTELNRTLRDRLVCGILDKDIQRKLLQQGQLTFEQACEMAVSHETANVDSNIIVSSGSRPTVDIMEEPMEVNKITSKKFQKPMDKSCFRCGKKHGGYCRFRWSKCNFCGKVGHIESVCMSKSSKNNDTMNSNCNGLYEEQVNLIKQERIAAFMIQVMLNKKQIEMEVDSGCAFTIISEATARLIFDGKLPKLEMVDIALKTWTDSKLQLLGKISLNVCYKDINENLTVYIAQGNGPSLIGRNWFAALKIQLYGINSVRVDCNKVLNLLQKYREVFQEGLGKYTGPVVSIIPREGSMPKFLKSRPIPFAIKERVIKEIETLVADDVLEPTPHAEWATPIVPVLKSNGGVRLCGDYRSTVNSAIDTDTYPLPTLNEAFAELQGGVLFSKIDLERAYTQVVVDEPTSRLLTLNTPKGLYKMKRLSQGIKACPGIFQRLMTSLLAGIPGVSILLDDVVLCGKNVEQHDQRLEMVLQRLQKAGLRVNKSKCMFAVKSVEFLGFIIDEFGIHPCEEKIHAIDKTQAPKNIKELQAFLGLLNFYDRFIPHKATVAEPLYRLLEKDAAWKWNKEHQEAFEKLKRMLSSKDTLVHYDMKKKLILSCDASQYGLGAVLEHEMNDGSIRPIMFASRTLNVHERNYAQVDKEAAAIIFGLKKFHQFISGRKVLIKTDHKPLLGIFNPRKPIPNIISPRMLRWALLLNSYDYEIEYVEGKKIGNADALSRWPSNTEEHTEDEEYLGVLLIEETPIALDLSALEVARLTRKDKILSKIMYWIRNGWPAKVENEFKVYWQKREELSTYQGCILWGSRVVLPEIMWSTVLEELHGNHDGIVITKALARSYFWWPALDKQIEDMVKKCDTCAEHRNMPPKVTHHWIRPDKPWSRLHVDYAGPFQGKMFLILIDAYSKWPEVKVVNDLSSATLIKELRQIFAEQGLPDCLVSDNGRSFISKEFKEYLVKNGIKQILVAPYHPASNGQAERTVQVIKNKLKKQTSEPWNVKLPKILYGLRSTPNTVTETTPAEMLNNRRFRTIFDNLNPLSYKNNKNNDTMESNENTKVRSFEVGQAVYVRNYCGNPRWLKGIVEKRVGVCRYLVKWNGKLLTRHINQMVTALRGEEHEDVPQDTIVQRTQSEDGRDIISLPPREQWAEIIGVSGPADVIIHQSPEVTSDTARTKRIRESPPTSPQPQKKYVMEDIDDSDLDNIEPLDMDVETQ